MKSLVALLLLTAACGGAVDPIELAETEPTPAPSTIATATPSDTPVPSSLDTLARLPTQPVTCVTRAMCRGGTRCVSPDMPAVSTYDRTGARYYSDAECKQVAFKSDGAVGDVALQQDVNGCYRLLRLVAVPVRLYAESYQGACVASDLDVSGAYVVEVSQ